MTDECEHMPVHHPEALSYRGCRIWALPVHTRRKGYGWSCEIPGLPGGGWAETIEEVKANIDAWYALIDQGKETDHAE